MAESSRLLLALLLPWLVGGLLVGWLAARLGRRRLGWPLVAGYGLLLGQVVVAGGLRLQNGLGGGIAFYPMVAWLLLLALALGWALRRAAPERLSPRWQAPPSGRGDTVVALLLVAGILLHLLPSLVEILWRPLFPWDAWTTWGHRAKLWVSHGALLPLVAPSQWASGEGYTISAHTYPLLVSLLQSWIALAWGAWSDTLINLPWLLAAVALLLLLYGHLRELRCSRTCALLPGYLLISQPLVHTHISLAGYADLWQAAFTGSGLVALLLGGQLRDRFWQGWGIALLLLGVAVKSEGMVWLLVALLLWGVLRLGRWGWLGLAGGLLLLAGGGYAELPLLLELPLLGTLGLVGSELHLPLLGVQQLGYNPIWGPLLANLWQYANWNLFWYLVVVALGVALYNWRTPFAKTGIIALLLPLAAVVAIFLLSDQGRWASDYTAINRLFIHFMPLWVVVVTLLLSGWQVRR